jgi:ectoine hydroxylase-related dioxygenase (phytanoyl-CoA dioxygenase family)
VNPLAGGVFAPDELDALDDVLVEHGFAILRGCFGPDEVASIERECTEAQRRVASGDLPDRFGSTILVDQRVAATDDATAVVNYVTHVNELSPAVLAMADHPVVRTVMERRLGGDAWLLDDARFGVVYQDARPGRDSSYSRIGWHSDWQSGPNLDIWPSVAFTFHLDPTSPANGFLRAVPGSHRWATPAPHANVNGAVVPPGSAAAGGHTLEPPPVTMPLGFDKVPGEVAVYAEVGDVIFHDAYLWHAAARGTDDGARRRHVRGGWFSGAGKLVGDHLDDFVKNAAR